MTRPTSSEWKQHSPEEVILYSYTVVASCSFVCVDSLALLRRYSLTGITTQIFVKMRSS